MHLMVDTALTVHEMLKSVADVNPTFMATSDKAAALRELVAVETRAAELRLRVMASAGDVADDEGFRSIATWMVHHTQTRRSDAAADLRLAESLDRGRPVLARALREARVNLSQARVIAQYVDELPIRVGVDVIAQAEAKLVELAGEHDPSELARLGRRILEIVDPLRFEAEEAKSLAAAEKRAGEKQRLQLRALGDGTTRLTALVPDAVAARLAKYLHAFTNPRLADGAVRTRVDEQDKTETNAFGASAGSGTSHPRRLAEAFGELLEVMDPTRLPIHGGDATHVMVTISLESLTTGLGRALIDNGVPGDGYDALTASDARRLACTAQIIPVVLGGKSEVLDLGRSARLFTKAQRRVLALRDQTCRAQGCNIPGTWSEAHHLLAWQHGGKTDLDNAVLLCQKHHHRAHEPAYDMTRLTNGDLRFHRIR